MESSKTLCCTYKQTAPLTKNGEDYHVQHELTHHRLKPVGSYGLSVPRRMNSTSAAHRNHNLGMVVIQHGSGNTIDFSQGVPTFRVSLGPLKPSPQRRGVFSPNETLNTHGLPMENRLAQEGDINNTTGAQRHYQS